MMTPEDREALQRAARMLESPGFVARLARWVGMPIEQLMKRLPKSAAEMVHRAVSSALEQCLHVALFKLEDGWTWFRSEPKMKVLAAATGAAGGALGIGALAVELPVTTSVMLRSIAEIARNEGEDVRSPEGRVACLEVLALGGGNPGGDPPEASYFALRAALAREVTDALRHLATNTASRKTPPVLVRLLNAIASRFSVAVTEKAAAGAVPVIGAIGGATVNALFMDHFQDIAHGHFTVRRLQRKYGEDEVRTEYQRCLSEMRG